MRKLILSLVISLLVFQMVGIAARADGMLWPEALSPDYLEVRYHHVKVEIQENHAVTRVEQEFYNPHPFPVVGRYVFPIPPDAILSNFQATVDGLSQGVTWQDRSATNAGLFDMVAQRQDPSLLQYADWESLTFDMDLPAGSSKKMLLHYEEVISPVGGLYHYRYILSTERYSSQPLDEVSVTVDLHSSEGLSAMYSSSHATSTQYFDANRARVTWEGQNVLPTEDFDLFFAPAGGGYGGGFLSGRREDQDHFMFLFAPEPELDSGEVLPKDVVFVVDRSGSMAGEKISQAQNALRFILGQLNPQDRFSIVGFDDRLTLFSGTLTTATSNAIQRARYFVDHLSADGNTDIEAALQTGLGIYGQSDLRQGVPKLMVFLTDGMPTAGVTDDQLIAQLVRVANESIQVRLHVFGVGYDVNSHLLDHLASENGGSVTYIQPGEDLEAVLSDFAGRIANPLLTDVEIEFSGIEVSDMSPQSISDLFQGSSVLITGRYRALGPAVVVWVRGKTGGQPREYRYEFDLNQTGDHDFVPRLWATRRIGSLLDQVRTEGERDFLVEEIRDLGLGYGIVTPYTTFVITPQLEGPASLSNMVLYADQAGLNQVSGQTTIQARVQNQQYQEANQANLAMGANLVHNGKSSVAQIGSQNLDLAVVRGQIDLNQSITEEWIANNLQVDREVTFGSEAYFELAQDPEMRTFLQSGPNVIFEKDGKVISVQQGPDLSVERYESSQGLLGVVVNLFRWLVWVIE